MRRIANDGNTYRVIEMELDRGRVLKTITIECHINNKLVFEERAPMHDVYVVRVFIGTRWSNRVCFVILWSFVKKTTPADSDDCNKLAQCHMFAVLGHTNILLFSFSLFSSIFSRPSVRVIDTISKREAEIVGDVSKSANGSQLIRIDLVKNKSGVAADFKASIRETQNVWSKANIPMFDGDCPDHNIEFLSVGHSTRQGNSEQPESEERTTGKIANRCGNDAAAVQRR